MIDEIFAWSLVVGCVLTIALACIAVAMPAKALPEPEFTEETPPAKPRYVTDAERRYHASNQLGR